MIAFWEECIQNAFNAFRMHSLHSGKNAFRMHSLLKPRTKNQDSPKTPEQILVLGSWFLVLVNQDLLRSLGGILVLGSWFKI